MTTRWRKHLLWVPLFAAALIGGELAARLDDRLRLEVPLLASPNAAYDLILIDSSIVRGRPYGRYEKIRLNAAGFRGAPIAPAAPEGCIRVITLGASESVVGGEAAGTEYPAFMQRALDRRGCFDVQNAAVSALNLARITTLWAVWARMWSARIVVVYPSPAFYLQADPPEYQSRPLPPIPKPAWWQPRLTDRFSWEAFWPEALTKWELRRHIAGKVAEHRRGWEFRRLPEDRLGLYERHLDSLVVAIQAAGAEPVLMTHARRFPDPPTAKDELLLLQWQRDSRATGPVILEFERAANARLVAVARRRGAMVVDADGRLSGRREWFTDFAHFTEAGREILGDLVADSVWALASRRLASARGDGRGVEALPSGR